MMMKRNTIQLSLVFEAVNKLRCHASADEIYEEILKEHRNISRGTIYRNLNRLSELGEIVKIENPGGADRFDHRCHKHYHARCVHCGRLFDVEMTYFAGLEQHIQKPIGFAFTGHDILFKGICSGCQAMTTGED